MKQNWYYCWILRSQSRQLVSGTLLIINTTKKASSSYIWLCMFKCLCVYSTCIYLIYTCVFKTLKNKWLPLRLGYQSHSLKCAFAVYTQDCLLPGPLHLSGAAASIHSQFSEPWSWKDSFTNPTPASNINHHPHPRALCPNTCQVFSSNGKV